MSNKIEKKRGRTLVNTHITDIYINENFYTAIVGIKKGDSVNYHYDYIFTHRKIGDKYGESRDLYTMFNKLKKDLEYATDKELEDLLDFD